MNNLGQSDRVFAEQNFSNFSGDDEKDKGKISPAVHFAIAYGSYIIIIVLFLLIINLRGKKSK